MRINLFDRELNEFNFIVFVFIWNFNFMIWFNFEIYKYREVNL